MMSFFRSLEAFFFAPHTARGFGLMRMGWAGVVLLFLLLQWSDVSMFYSNDGLLPMDLAPTVLRATNRYSILFWATSPEAVFGFYLFLLVSLTLMLLGIFPRLTTILSVLLLFSFHERNPMILGGGDTLLRTIGFILMIAPNIQLFSILPRSPITDHRSPVMPIWPYRLLLWQMIVLYGTSFWYKLLGTLWMNGTAVDTALHHPVFARWPQEFMTLLTPVTPLIDWTSLLWEALWILLLVPRFIVDLLPPQLPRLPLKRILMLGGILFHGSIFLLMDAGSFSLAIFAAYCGLLDDTDIQWLRRLWHTLFIRT